MYKYNLKSHCVDEQPEFKQPNIELYKSILGEWHSIATKDRYFSDLATYTSYIASLRSIPVSGKVEWKDGQELIEGKDFTIDKLQYHDDIAEPIIKQLQPFDFEKLDADIKAIFPMKNQSQEQPIESEDELWLKVDFIIGSSPNWYNALLKLKELYTIKRKT